MAEQARLADEARLQRLAALPPVSPGTVDLAEAALEDERAAVDQHSTAPSSSEEGNANATVAAAAEAQAGFRAQHKADLDDHAPSATELRHVADRHAVSYSEGEIDTATADDGERRVDAEHTSSSGMRSKQLDEVRSTLSSRLLAGIWKMSQCDSCCSPLLI
eukprot:COSAG02_NODE_28488_length_588_cov_1.472393_1_plen_161_part_01